MRSLVLSPNPVLYRRAEEVVVFDDELKQLVEDMKRVLEEHQGAGLAAPQVGESRRLFVVRTKAHGLYTLVNPVIVNASNLIEQDFEGCLSLPHIAGAMVDRWRWVEYEAQDVDGNPLKGKLTDFESRVFQHELDHLNGFTILERVPRSKMITHEQASNGKTKLR